MDVVGVGGEGGRRVRDRDTAGPTAEKASEDGLTGWWRLGPYRERVHRHVRCACSTTKEIRR